MKTMYRWTITCQKRKTKLIASVDEIFELADRLESEGRGARFKKGGKVK